MTGYGDESWEWLESTRWLQSTHFGVDYDEMTGEALATYLMMNAFSLTDELHEAMSEVQWKPWSTNRGAINRSDFIGECVDAMHFLGNMLAAVGVTDSEFWDAYRAKQQRNVNRQVAGYDAARAKCPKCKRELDKPDSTTRSSSGYWVVCAHCQEQLGQVDFTGVVAWRPEVDGALVWQRVTSSCPACQRDLTCDGTLVYRLLNDSLEEESCLVMCSACDYQLGTQVRGQHISWGDTVTPIQVTALSFASCTCDASGTDRPRADASCVIHHRNRNDTGIPM